MTPADRAFELVNGFRFTQMVHAAVELRIPDLVAIEPRSLEELSSATGIESSRLRRLLRGLVALGVLRESDEGYGNTEVGELFREGVEGSRRPQLRMLIPESYRNWDHFLETLRTGVTGQQLAHGATLWDLIARDPDFGTRFNDAMAGHGDVASAIVADSGDFSKASVVVDVGGGEGSLLAAVLVAHPRLRGIVFDLAGGLVQTTAYMEARGLAERVALVEGSFFETVPEGDVYLLRDILHDWDDERATEILRVCRRTMKSHARLMVVERMAPATIAAGPAHANSTVIDLQMLVQLGGKERTLEEMGDLFEAAGLKLDRFTPGEVWQLVEAVAV